MYARKASDSRPELIRLFHKQNQAKEESKVQLKLIQTKSSLSAAYELRKGEQLIARAEIANNFTYGGSCKVYRGEALEYIISCELGITKASTRDKKAVKRQYKLTDAMGNEYGKIREIRVKTGFLSYYDYTELSLDGQGEYEMYEIGLGKEGMKFPIYRGNIQIAQLEKGTVVRNNLDEYDIYAKDEQAARIGWLLCLYKDITEYANRGEIVYKSAEVSYTRTMNKALLSKYDPSFAQRMGKRE